MSQLLSTADLRALDDEVALALKTGQTKGLRILGYGEISTVVAWSTPKGEVACKRLPPFRKEARLLAYGASVDHYLDELKDHGVTPVPTGVHWFERGRRELIAYCVQPLQPASSLLVERLKAASDKQAQAYFNHVAQAIRSCVSPNLGIDGQASNWVMSDDGALAYLDVSTPLIRDEAGAEQLDTELFLASLPLPMRSPVRRWMLRGILDKYYDQRGVVLDFLGNLHKEALPHLVSPLLRVANSWVTPPLTEVEVLRYYRSDAATWALLQRLRRFDRGWHRATGKVYPFLLPGKVDRHV